MVRHHAVKRIINPISCVIDMHYVYINIMKKEVNFSIILWLNVEIESLFTSLDSSAWLLTCDHINNIFIAAQTQCQINLYTSKKDINILSSRPTPSLWFIFALKFRETEWCHVKQWCNLQGSYEQTPLVPVSLIIICTASRQWAYNLYVQQPNNLYSAWREPWTRICYYHSTVNSSN